MTIRNSIFFDNNANGLTGDAIYASNTLNFIELTQCTFSSTFATNFLDIISVYNVSVDSSSFSLTAPVSSAGNKTTGFHLSEINMLTI